MDKKEKGKYESIDAALKTSPRLCEVEQDSQLNERMTAREFTKSMNVDFQGLLAT